MSLENGAPEAQSAEESIEVEDQEGSESPQEIKQEIKEQKKMLRKLKLKFNGKETEEELPFDIPEEHAEYMTKQLQMARLSQHKSQELSQFEKEVGAFLQDLKKNPKKALSNPAIGIDIKQFAAEILEDEIRQSQKSPEQIEKEALEAELQALKEEREKEKQDFSQKELERLTQAEFERYDNLMTNALNTSDLPKSPYVVKKMTEYMIEAVENGIDVEPNDIIPLIRNEMLSDVQDLLRSMPPEMIEQILGTDIITALRKNRVALAKKPPIPVKSAVKDIGQKGEKKVEIAKQQTIKDFFGI